MKTDSKPSDEVMISKMRIEAAFREDALRALTAAMRPFGSLHGQMADVALTVAQDGPEKSESTLQLLGMAFSYEGDNHADVQFTTHGVTFVTPTSKTEITVLHGWDSRDWQVIVTFPGGSFSRAAEIREIAAVKWEVIA